NFKLFGIFLHLTFLTLFLIRWKRNFYSREEKFFALHNGKVNRCALPFTFFAIERCKRLVWKAHSPVELLKSISGGLFFTYFFSDFTFPYEFFNKDNFLFLKFFFPDFLPKCAFKFELRL